MKIEYKNKPIDWDNAGVTPPQDLIERGFQAGYKPPAEYFNALLHTTSEAIKELQTKTVELSEQVDSGTGAGGGDIIDATCTYSSSVFTLTPSETIESASYFCLRFKAPNNCTQSSTFKIGETNYTKVGVNFTKNDVVILSFDVSQQKCFLVSSKIGSAGKNVAGETFTIDNVNKIASVGAEIFNSYDNKATGFCSSAFGYETIASGDEAFASGYETKASGNNAFASGYKTKASGDEAFASGGSTTANGNFSFACGNTTTANGNSSFACGIFANALGQTSFASGHGTIANELNFVIGRYNKTPTAASDSMTSSATGDLFVIGNGTDVSKTNAFRVAANGNVYGTKAYTASGADYAEMFEWAEGNPDNEDRRGLFVTLDGEEIRLANANDDYILGVVSATPSVVADAQTDDWSKKWKTDIFGERLLDENGAWILNEDFRNEDNENYVSRLDRKEWAAVGLVGKLIVVDDGTCEVNGYCVPANGGIATKSETGYRVLSRIDENHIKVLIK